MYRFVSNSARIRKGRLPITSALSPPTITDWDDKDKRVPFYFEPPQSDGGFDIVTYYYRLDGGDWVNMNTTTSPFTIEPLVNGQPYELEIRAENDIGVISSASNKITVVPGEVWETSEEIWEESQVIWSE